MFSLKTLSSNVRVKSRHSVTRQRSGSSPCPVGWVRVHPWGALGRCPCIAPFLSFPPLPALDPPDASWPESPSWEAAAGGGRVGESGQVHSQPLSHCRPSSQAWGKQLPLLGIQAPHLLPSPCLCLLFSSETPACTVGLLSYSHGLGLQCT